MSLAGQITALLAAPKQLAARGEFVEGNRPSQFRANLPVAVNGEVGSVRLQLITMPSIDDRWLRIVLLAPKSIWRLCLKHEDHKNNLDRPKDVPLLVFGPHYHAWADNQHFATEATLPDRLKNARLLPADVDTKDKAFLWFLDQTGIERPVWGALEWPTRTTLL